MVKRKTFSSKRTSAKRTLSKHKRKPKRKAKGKAEELTAKELVTGKKKQRRIFDKPKAFKEVMLKIKANSLFEKCHAQMYAEREMLERKRKKAGMDRSYIA